MIFFLYQISEEKTLLSYSHSTGYVVKVAMPHLIYALLMGSFNLIMSFGNGIPIRNDALIQTISCFFMFLFVGLFEEMTFRAVINDAVIKQFRNSKYVFVISALLCSIVFGAAHVVGAKLTSPLAWVQAIGKTVSSGIFGLSLLFVYWKTRNIWACGVVHGVYDFLVSISSCIFEQSGSINGYVASDEYAMPAITIYILLTVVELIILYIIWKKIGKKIDYYYIRENW